MHTLFSNAKKTRVALGAGLALMAATVLPGCSTAARQGQSSSYLIIDMMQAASGAEPTKMVGSLSSDVLTKNSVFSDPAQVTLRLALKDPGSTQSPTQPTTANYITVNRYHVRYLRSDGRNTQGVDVPFEFDGASTVTVGNAPAVLAITLVRASAKVEAPLFALVNGGGAQFIATIAEVTMYGKDQTGREVMVTGSISVNFADWADPAEQEDEPKTSGKGGK